MRNREGLELFTFIILLIIIKVNVDAHPGCYICNECANPFSSQAAGVSLSTECRFCKTTFTYGKNMMTVSIAKSCGQMNETCINRYIAWYNTTTEESCCMNDLCNASNIKLLKPIVCLFISGLVILLTC